VSQLRDHSLRAVHKLKSRKGLLGYLRKEGCIFVRSSAVDHFFSSNSGGMDGRALIDRRTILEEGVEQSPGCDQWARPAAVAGIRPVKKAMARPYQEGKLPPEAYPPPPEASPETFEKLGVGLISAASISDLDERRLDCGNTICCLSGLCPPPPQGYAWKVSIPRFVFIDLGC
jgi:hypothetical protein